MILLGRKFESKSNFPYYWYYCSVTKSCPTLCYPMNCSTSGFTVLHYLPEFVQTHSIESVMPSNHLILCCSLLLLPSIFPSIRVLSNESVLHIRWPEYWSVSISPSNEYRRLISSGSVHVNHSVMSDSLRPHESQQSRPPCSSPTPRVHSDSCPSSQ